MNNNDGVSGKMFWWLMKKINFWLWASWLGSYLQRSLSAQVNPDATSDRWTDTVNPTYNTVYYNMAIPNAW